MVKQVLKLAIVSRCGFSIDACRENQTNKHKLALQKLSIHFKNSLKPLYILSTAAIKVGVV